MISHINQATSRLFCQNRLLLQPCRQSHTMLAWKVGDSLDNSAEVDIRHRLQLMETKKPFISSPSDVLVKVHSTSVNPLDVRMTYGYGRRVLDLLDMATNFEPRITNDRYPLTLGRDFSGEVVATGPYSEKIYKPGDLVFGAIDPQRSGSHTQFVSVPSYCLTKKPENLTHNQAASIPFIALTAYSALSTFGHLTSNNCSGKHILVLGGSGGVGSFAIQLLKLWNASTIVATCSEEKIDWLENELFVDQAIDYSDAIQMESLRNRFDFVLDCADYDRTSLTRQNIIEKSLNYLKSKSQSVYVTLSPPILSNTDEHGLILGTAKTAMEAISDTLMGLTNLNSARWAVFLPNKAALDYISQLFKDESITPQVSSVFSFHQLPEAYKELQSGKAKGKVVVDVLKTKDDGEKPEQARDL